MKSADDRYNPKSCRFSKEWMFLQAVLTALALNTELGVANDEIDGISNVLLEGFMHCLLRLSSEFVPGDFS